MHVIQLKEKPIGPLGLSDVALSIQDMGLQIPVQLTGKTSLGALIDLAYWIYHDRYHTEAFSMSPAEAREWLITYLRKLIGEIDEVLLTLIPRTPDDTSDFIPSETPMRLLPHRGRIFANTIRIFEELGGDCSSVREKIEAYNRSMQKGD